MGFSGTWNMTMKTPMGNREVALTLDQDGDALTGKMDADGTSAEVKDGKVEGSRGQWKANLTTPMPITLEFDVTQSGDALEGTVKLGMFGTSEVTGTKQ